MDESCVVRGLMGGADWDPLRAAHRPPISPFHSSFDGESLLRRGEEGGMRTTLAISNIIVMEDGNLCKVDDSILDVGVGDV